MASPPPYDIPLSPLDVSSPRSSSDGLPSSPLQTPPTPHFLYRPTSSPLSSPPPLPDELLPPYPGPIQYIFNSLDVLSSAVVEAHTGRTVMSTSTQGEHTVLADGQGGVVCHVTWGGQGPRLAFEEGEGGVKLEKWMSRVHDERILLRVTHNHKKFDVYQAGTTAIGIKYTNTKSMLCGIRDPYKYTELILSREALEPGSPVLLVAVLLVVLLKSKKPLGKDFEQRKVVDRLWKGVDRVFESIGNAQRGGRG